MAKFIELETLLRVKRGLCFHVSSDLSTGEEPAPDQYEPVRCALCCKYPTLGYYGARLKLEAAYTELAEPFFAYCLLRDNGGKRDNFITVLMMHRQREALQRSNELFQRNGKNGTWLDDDACAEFNHELLAAINKMKL